MQGRLRRIRAAVAMGLLWALVWAPVAVLIGTQLVDPDDSMDEMWWMVGALPGFLSGVAFSVLLGIVARRRRLEELSVARVGGWGAAAGLLIGMLPFLLGDRGGRPMWPLALVVLSSITLLSAVSAAGSLAMAQRAQRRESRDGGASPDDVGPADGGLQELPGARVAPGPSRPAAAEKAARPTAGG
jgi:hypothetical protein